MINVLSTIHGKRTGYDAWQTYWVRCMANVLSTTHAKCTIVGGVGCKPKTKNGSVGFSNFHRKFDRFRSCFLEQNKSRQKNKNEKQKNPKRSAGSGRLCSKEPKKKKKSVFDRQKTEEKKTSEKLDFRGTFATLALTIRGDHSK